LRPVKKAPITLSVVKEPYREGDVWVATVFDPAGNVIGIWQFAPR